MSAPDSSAVVASPQQLDACPLCGTHEMAPWTERVWPMPGTEVHYSYRRCALCETISCHPLPSSEMLGLFYQQHYNYKWFEKVRWLKAIQGAHRWQRVNRLLKRKGVTPGRLLDVGCGHGWFLKRAQQSGWSVTGIDYPSLATRHARQTLGLELVEGDVLTLVDQGRLTGGRFDLITAWHCLEHHPRPLNLLKVLAELLTPGGKLLVAVPNAESIGMRQKREEWVWCQPPYVHLFHFTESALTALVEKAGLHALDAWTRDTWDAHPAGDWTISRDLGQLSWRYVGLISGRAAYWVQEAAFWLEECCRVGSYISSCRQHWLYGEESPNGLGSELVVLAETHRDSLE